MFVRAPNPIWYFVNLNGLQLNDTYYAFFLSNVFPYLPQTVYADPAGTIPWSSPLQFYANGTLPDNLYFDPTLTYRIEIRQGNTQSSPLIYEINNVVPESGASITTTSTFSTTNQIANPQFSLVNFVTPLNISAAGTYNVAPGWNLVLTGSGTASVSQVTIAPNSAQINSPPFALDITTNGWTTANLIQTFAGNGALWASTPASGSIPAQQGVVSESITAVAIGSAYTVSLLFSNGATGGNVPPVIATGSIATGNYQVLAGSQFIPQQNNPASTGVSMNIQLQGTGEIRISNAQLIGETVPTTILTPPTSPAFQQATPQDNINGLFNYYYNSIIMQPKDSVLTAWNFGLNPWQFTPVASTNVATNAYTADQTIVVQQNYVASATGNNIAVGQASAANNYGFQATAVTAHNQFALIQYIDPATIRPYWGSTLSSLVTALFTTTHSTTPPKVKMRLIWNASLPASTSQTVPIASWSEGGDPVFSAGWTAITPINDTVYSLGSTSSEYAFNGFVLPTQTSATMTLGIVLYTVGDMNQASTADFLVINDVSLVPNQFALPSNPKTWDQVLKECQYYYEKSYDNGTLPATSGTPPSFLQYPQPVILDSGGSNYDLYASTFEFQFNTVKRTVPTVILYSPLAGTAANVDVAMFIGATNTVSPTTVAATDWNGGTIGTKSARYHSSDAAAGTILQTGVITPPLRIQGVINFHFTANATLGQ